MNEELEPRAFRRWPVVTRWSMAVVLLVGCVLRLLGVNHPADADTLASWRDSDYTQIARTYHREGIEPFRPRIDWRGETSGVAEMELPVLPVAAALLYRIFGYHEEILRLLSALAAVTGLVAFAVLARLALPPLGALAGTAVVAFKLSA